MILFVFICKGFFQLISFMYETKLKGHDGIAVYKPLHFSADFIGNFSQISTQGHRQRGGQWCPAPHLKSVPPISRLAHRLLHISNTVF